MFEFQNDGLRHVGFHIFAIFVKNSIYRVFICRLAKFGEDRTNRGRIIAYFRFPIWRQSPSCIINFRILSNGQISAYVYVDMQILVNIGRCMPELLIIFYFQYGGLRHLGFPFLCNICLKIHSCAYFNVDMQNLVKIARSAVKLLGIFDFQTGGLCHL